jgi:two-component system LytT family sensor kinase
MSSSEVTGRREQGEALGLSAPAVGSEVEGARRHWIEISDLNWPLVFLAYTVVGVITTDTVYTSELAQRNSGAAYFYPLIWEMTGHWTAFLLAPVIVLAFSRLPVRRQNWFWTVPVHMLISIGVGVIHTLLMYVSRLGLYNLLGLGVYDYGQMGYRFVMEYHKQFLNYWGVYAVLRVLAHYREARRRDRRAAALELKTSDLQKALAQVQLQALRSQLNPHFLFNTLNMVSSVMYEDVNRADQMISALSRMLRLSLEEGVGPRVPVRRELEFVRCAVELIEARFQERVAIQIHCAPECQDELMPNLLLYTLIENSVKHHDLERESIIRVEARIRRTDASLEIDVLDNGPGIVDVENALGRGVGLSNTKQRLAALYDTRYRFELENRPQGGLHAQVSIPLDSIPKTLPAMPNPSIQPSRLPAIPLAPASSAVPGAL